MQGLVARRGQMAPDPKDSRKDSTVKLMETATKMMKNGVTPDVVTFINATITEINDDVLGAIIDEHNRDQQLIYDEWNRIVQAVDTMEVCAASIRSQHQDREDVSDGHKMCRSEESLACARSRRCEEELEELWRRVVIEEEEMRRIHYHIHLEWCLAPAPPHPSLADPFQWTLSHHYEGDETSQSLHEYPIIDLESNVIEFRRFSVEYFGFYIIQLPRVEIAWERYWAKLTECAALEETWELHVQECDDLQTHLRDAACMHAETNRQCAADFGHEYWMAIDSYEETERAVRILEADRKREWETLHIVKCLLRTVYTHIIHSIDSGEPCPTTESHPEQTVAEINYCHVVETNLTVHLDIIYPPPPPPPVLPPVVPPPCTAEYVWQEHGSFSVALQSSHSAQIVAEGLEEYFTLISAFGWAGCAAPKACIPCEVDDLVVDPEYTGVTTCLAHHGHLNAGQMDWDTFKCLNGNQCIRASGRCNEVANCGDGSDEIGCDNHWGIPSILQAEECNDPFVGDLQFRCADNMCTPMAGKCNGVNNCADGSDEVGCATSPHGTTIEAMTGYTATFETPELHSHVFYDREYTFDSLGSFTGHSYIKMYNEDKHISGTHVQMKLRLPRPLTIYVVKLDNSGLPWLAAEGWSPTHLEGVSYHGVRPTRHTDWSGILNEDFYGPGEVYQKTFAAGTVELQGNNGGDGSYLMFVAHPENAPEPTDGLPGQDTFIGCFSDDTSRDLGAMVGAWTNSATNTYELCRAECASRNNRYMSLQFGGECFCADAYATADQYSQVDASECNVGREPCSPNSHNCGGTWRNAIYQIQHATSDGCLTSNANQNGEHPTTFVNSNDPATTAAVRCCSSDGSSCTTQDLPGSIAADVIAPDGTDVGSVEACRQDVSYFEARGICEEAGLRLCSSGELDSGVCCGTGCWHDHRAIWTSN